MESSNFYQQQQHQLASFSSLAAQSIPGVAAIHDGNPSLHLNIDDYNRYMNETLPNSADQLLMRKNNFPDMGYDEYESCPNLWASKTSWASPAAFSSGSSNLGILTTTSSLDSTHLGMNYNAQIHSSKQDSSLSTYDSINRRDSSSNKIWECRDKAIWRTKRVISSTSSQRRPSQDEVAKKQKAVSQSSCSLPKVGKEKIGDRIAALHRLVAPFGKTDAASVLTEAIGYVQFLHNQIQTLSMPCIKPSQRDRHPFEWVSGKKDEKQDLRSRGLCLVPLSIAAYISSSCAGPSDDELQY